MFYQRLFCFISALFLLFLLLRFISPDFIIRFYRLPDQLIMGMIWVNLMRRAGAGAGFYQMHGLWIRFTCCFCCFCPLLCPVLISCYLSALADHKWLMPTFPFILSPLSVVEIFGQYTDVCRSMFSKYGHFLGRQSSVSQSIRMELESKLAS